MVPENSSNKEKITDHIKFKGIINVQNSSSITQGHFGDTLEKEL
jgi:hypothetical protein